MPARFVNIDHDTPLLLPPDLRDWVPEDHLVHFIMEAVGMLDLSAARIGFGRQAALALTLNHAQRCASQIPCKLSRSSRLHAADFPSVRAGRKCAPWPE